MRKNLSRRFWSEIVLASFTGLLGLITPVFPDWIEAVSGWDPDQHDGSVERMIVVGLCFLSIAIFSLAAVEWRRAALAES
ncbi:MAG: hypothetical protein JO223_04670 [Hyphomicrobiales bacterium]|nr:hypothetical protein [Hyphomicrobiales bacterium]MBV8441424.1 hypothetical protein [Hyphomicrobiales bacterium]